MKQQIRKLLYALWGGTILNFHYDLVSHQIRCNVRIRSRGKATFYRIFIDEISSIIFHGGNIAEYAHNGELSDDDAIGDEWGILEVTSFDYYPEFNYQLDFPSKDGSEVASKGVYNLVLEIWDEIFILARRLKINDQEFTLF